MASNIIRKPEVCKRCGLSRSTIYRHILNGTFPKPVSISIRAVGWPLHWVEAINAARIAGKSDEEIQELVRKLEANCLEDKSGKSNAVEGFS